MRPCLGLVTLNVAVAEERQQRLKEGIGFDPMPQCSDEQGMKCVYIGNEAQKTGDGQGKLHFATS